MATYFSDHYNVLDDAGLSQTSADMSHRAASGTKHARVRYSRASLTALLTTASSDVARLMTLKSNARIHAIYIQSGGEAAAGACNVGLYKTGVNHDGAVVDADLFASASTAPSADTARTEIMVQAGTLTDEQRGTRLWELAGESSDPQIEYDITMEASTTFTTTAPEIIVEVYYTVD